MPSRALLLLVVLSFAGLGCPKQPPPPEPATPAPTPERAPVGVDSMEPTRTTLGRGVTVRLEGWGFADGSEVYLGSRKARGVDVIEAGELTFRATEDLPAGRYDVRVETPAGDQAKAPVPFEVTQPKVDDSQCSLQVVYFDFDDAGLRSDARSALASNADCIEKRKIRRIRLEGHADERGSTVYNLGLGQRRVDSVKKYLADRGIDVSQVQAVSYGEEQPADPGYGEDAWAKNRRVEFVAE